MEVAPILHILNFADVDFVDLSNIIFKFPSLDSGH